MLKETHMKLLKLFFLIFLTILLSLVIQIPTYLGMNYFENNTVCKILIGLAAFSLKIIGEVTTYFSRHGFSPLFLSVEHFIIFV
ncbi:Uncharacterised protein [Streptococcus dysgalactiae subsp. equisimilis]|nr:Uncharacterised protein [Streptococcus dysgalactiae subsp. equisimilis]